MAKFGRPGKRFMAISENNWAYTTTDCIDGDRIIGLKSVIEGLPLHFEYTGKVLPVNFSAKEFYLPIATINPGEKKEEHISIAYFDPRRPDLVRAAAHDMGEIIARLPEKTTVMMFPPSSKSMALSYLVCAETMLALGKQDVKMMHFSGGDDQFLAQSGIKIKSKGDAVWHGEDVIGKSIWGVSYQPVTALGTQRQKHLWLTEAELHVLREIDSRGVILGDDIVTTRATIGAMKTVLKFLNWDAQKMPVVAAALEGNEPCSDSSIKSVIRLPEWVGQF